MQRFARKISLLIISALIFQLFPLKCLAEVEVAASAASQESSVVQKLSSDVKNINNEHRNLDVLFGISNYGIASKIELIVPLTKFNHYLSLGFEEFRPYGTLSSINYLFYPNKNAIHTPSWFYGIGLNSLGPSGGLLSLNLGA